MYEAVVLDGVSEELELSEDPREESPFGLDFLGFESLELLELLGLGLLGLGDPPESALPSSLGLFVGLLTGAGLGLGFFASLCATASVVASDVLPAATCAS